MKYLDRIIQENINRFLVKETMMDEDSRMFVPKVRGGWTEKKILKYLKSRSSATGLKAAIKEIATFNDAKELEQHLFWHGSAYRQTHLKPSITQSERWAAQYGGGGYGDRYYGISLTNIKRIATNFDYLHETPSVHLVIVKKDAVIKNMEGMISDSIDVNDIIVDLYTEGVDGVWIGGGEGELVIINPYAIINVTEVIQHFDMRCGRSDNNPLSRNPLENELQELLDSCKEYVEFSTTNTEPHVPIMPTYKPQKPKDEWAKYDWYKDDMEKYNQKMETYNQKMQKYNDYIANPSEINTQRQPFVDRRNKIIQQMKFNNPT